jgi:hypothetical protein
MSNQPTRFTPASTVGPAVIEQSEQRAATTIDAMTGQQWNFPIRAEQVIVDEATGSQRFQAMEYQIIAVDGRMVSANAWYSCRSCGTKPLSEQAMRHCNHCEAMICRSCAAEINNGFLCNSCAKRERRGAFWRWMLSIK